MSNVITIHSTPHFNVVVQKSNDPEMNEQFVYAIIDTQNKVINMETSLLPNAIQAANELENQYNNVLGESASVEIEEPQLTH